MQECMICFDDITETQNKAKCKRCKKIIHLKCYQKWIESRQSKGINQCIHCQGFDIIYMETGITQGFIERLLCCCSCDAR